MSNRLFIIPIMTLLVLGSVWGQGGQRQRPNQEPAPPIRTPQYGEQTPQRSQQRTIFLNGLVLLEDGTRPQQPVQVELVCYGAVRQQVYSSGGQFSFDLGRSKSLAMTESSVSGAPSDSEFLGNASLSGSSGIEPAGNTLDLSGCELRASLSGFRSDTIRLGRRRALDNPNVGEIVLHRLAGVEGTSISINTSRAPKKAKKAFENAQKELRKKDAKPSRAAKELEKAVKEFSEFAEAWYLLGEMRLALQDQSGAQEAFQQAISSDPEYITPYLSLAELEISQGRLEAAARLSKEVIGLNPYVTNAYYLNAAANYSLGNLDEAEESAQKVTENKEARLYPQTYFILGGILAQKGNVSSATAEFNYFLEVQPEGTLADQVKQILSEWKKQGLIGEEPAGGAPKD